MMRAAIILAAMTGATHAGAEEVGSLLSSGGKVELILHQDGYPLIYVSISGGDALYLCRTTGDAASEFLDYRNTTAPRVVDTTCSRLN